MAAALKSKSLHRPWTSAPSDTLTFKHHLARMDGLINFSFAVYVVDTDEIVGAIHITNVIYGAFRSGYLGYYAFAGYERKGYMKSGLWAVVRYAFGTLKLHRLEANIQPGNLASIALVRSCGFSQEGLSPAYLKIAGKWRDHERWAIVRGRSTPQVLERLSRQ